MLNSTSKIYKEITMPNIKSAIKRVQVSEKKSLQNRMIKSQLNTFIKKFKKALVENIEQAEALLQETFSLLDKAAAKNVIHENKASRKKAHLAKLLSDAKSK